MEELSDHLQDLKEEGMEADEVLRLGEPEQVAAAAVVAYQRRSVLGRHSWAAFVVFGLSPVVSLVAMVALAIGGLVALPDGWDTPLLARIRACGPSASVAVAYFGSLLTIVVPSLVVSSFYCWLAGRSGIGKKWMLLSCVTLALLAALPMCTAKVSAVPKESWLRIGLWTPDSIRHSYHLFAWTFCRPQQLMQFLAPLAIGCWFLRRKRERQVPLTS